MDKFENFVYKSLMFLLVISVAALIGMTLSSACDGGPQSHYSEF